MKMRIVHDVRFVHGGDFLAIVFDGVVEGETGDAFDISSRYNLQTFDDSRNRLQDEHRYILLCIRFREILQFRLIQFYSFYVISIIILMILIYNL